MPGFRIFERIMAGIGCVLVFFIIMFLLAALKLWLTDPLRKPLFKKKGKSKMTREETLKRAAECVCKDREDDYGSPEDSFGTIAKLWTAYLEHDITAADVSIMMALLKIARLKGGYFKEDSFVDLAGYAACGAEIATEKATDIPKKDEKEWPEYDLVITEENDLFKSSNHNQLHVGAVCKNLDDMTNLIDKFNECISKYGKLTVADILVMCTDVTHSHIDKNYIDYGWTEEFHPVAADIGECSKWFSYHRRWVHCVSLTFPVAKELGGVNDCG